MMHVCTKLFSGHVIFIPCDYKNRGWLRAGRGTGMENGGGLGMVQGSCECPDVGTQSGVVVLVTWIVIEVGVG